ncbi:MAG: hypothetical protein NTX42_07890 [Methanothrix sp.]|nr:hypothetical protein [Methanothrix sp.]
MAIKIALLCFIVLLGIASVAAYDDDFVVITDKHQSDPDPYQPDPYQPDPYQPDPYQPDPYQPDPNQNDGDMYSFSISESTGTLIDESTSSDYSIASIPQDKMAYGWPGGSQNSFWITNRDGTRFTQSVSMPLNSYARAVMIPATSGQLILEETYPNGRNREYNIGRVNAFRQYRIWFFADSRGTHISRYHVDNGPYSDTLRHNVG